MRQLRDLFYINGNATEHYFVYYGMTFQEFVAFSPNKIENVLLMDQAGWVGQRYDKNWNLEVVSGTEGIEALCKEDLYSMGNFHWIDYRDEESLARCSPQEQAEILYLSHFCKPLVSPFNETLGNSFVYLAHDDGWFCRLFCKDISVMQEIVAEKVRGHFSDVLEKTLPPLSLELKSGIFELVMEGLLMDFSSLKADDGNALIRLYCIGEFQDMDQVYNERRKHMTKAKVIKYLEFADGAWQFQDY